jgi:hypothetical protein
MLPGLAGRITANNQDGSHMHEIETIRTIVDDGALLTEAYLYADNDLGGQCVGVDFVFSDRELFIHAQGLDDTVRISSTLPTILLDEAIHRLPGPNEWNSAIGQPILWAWTMTNTQGRIDGIQLEFGTISSPSITLQIVVRASTLVLRSLR